MEFPTQIIDEIRELYGSVKGEAQRLKTEAEEAARTERVWADLEKFLMNGWVLHVLELLDREAPRLKRMRAENNPAFPAIENSYRLAKDESERLLRRYPTFLEEACRAANLCLDSTSRHPKYSLERGFFLLEIDEKKRLARLSDYEGRLAEHPADVQAVVETVQREHQRIFGKSFSGPKFLTTLRAQYKAVLEKEKLVDGAPVPIRHITTRMGKNIEGFRTDKFLIDLSRLAEEGPFEIDGRRLDLQQTKDTNQGMLLYGASARGYIGFVIFKEV